MSSTLLNPTVIALRITADRLAEELTRQPADSIVHRLIECIGDGVAVCASDGRTSLYNSAAEAMLGNWFLDLTPKNHPAPYGIFYADTLTPLPIEKLPLRRALRGRSVDGAEIFIRNRFIPEGKWISSTARPLCDSAGNFTGAVSVFRDITAWKRAELAARDFQERFRFLFENDQAGIVYSNVEGAILEANQSFARWLGRTREDLLGYRMEQLYADPRDRDAMLRNVMAAGYLHDYEVRFRKVDGSEVWCLANIRFVPSGPGGIGGTLVSTMIDITERRKGEQALMESQRRFASFMHHLPGVAFIKDQKGRYIYYNDACAALFQTSPEELIGKSDDRIWPAELAARFRENDATVLRTGAPLQTLEALPLPDGLHHWLIHKFPITGEADQEASIGAIGIDITERKHLEEQLRQSHKMEAIGKLAGGVAHDFNNLLTVIGGYGHMLTDAIDQGAAVEKLRLYVTEILNSSDRAAALTNQLLAFSRRQVIHPRVLDLHVVVRNAENMLRRVIGEHIELRVAIEGVCRVKADVGQVEQVILNLAVNARDAMPRGGTLTIRIAAVDWQAPDLANDSSAPPERAAHPFALLEVTDTGTGIDAATQAHLFEPFFTSKMKGRGTGLGLSTVYGIVKQSGGHIAVESEPGKGAKFLIYLPRVEDEPESAANELTTPATEGTETILLVEDETGVREMVREMLSKKGYSILEAGSGRQALLIYAQNRDRVDLLLTDMIMPQMNGNELASRLRTADKNLKVLFMSGYTDDVIANQGMTGADVMILQKPFSADQLSAKIRAVLDR